jgi:hypothetical protein
MQRELLDQRVTQLVIVVNDQNFSAVRHRFPGSRELGEGFWPGAAARNRAFAGKRASGIGTKPAVGQPSERGLNYTLS